MKRRSFLGLMTGAVVAGPQVAQKAAMQMSDLQLPGIATGGLGEVPSTSVDSAKGQFSAIMEAKERLGRLLNKSPEQIEYEKKSVYIGGLDPDVAMLQSMTLTSKMRMQKRLNYERAQAREIDVCNNIINGLIFGRY